MSELITLTFGDMAENHKGMEQIGTMRKKGEGFHLNDLEHIKHTLEAKDIECQLISLAHEAKIDGNDINGNDIDAHVLVIRDGVNAILKDYDESQLTMFEEQKTLEYDKKAFMYGRVVNKHARWNLCFDDISREADYKTGKGTIVGYAEVPIMKAFMDEFPEYFGEKSNGLKVESNYYYDSSKTGIGFHGDSERRIVIAARLGYAHLPIHYQWFHKGNAIGEQVVIPLAPGDMYIMCEKAVGTDWKCKNTMTLRHATGASKYTTL